MKTLGSEPHVPADHNTKDEIADSVNSSPSSRSSSSSDDVFSNGYARSSQSSAPSSTKGSPITYDSEPSSDAEYLSANVEAENGLLNGVAQVADRQCPVAAGLRRHPRRTLMKVDQPELKHESASRRPVPTLIRQCDRKEQFVEALVDTTTEMIEVVWPNSIAHCSIPQGGKNILDLRKFVQEVLRRSKTSYSTLQVALFYLVLLIPYVPRPEVPERREDPPVCRALRCGRRMFLAALILASKYLQDRNYTMLAWAKISGLKKEEICFNELAFLRTVNYDLHIPEQLFKDWADIVLKFSLEDECRRARAMNGGRCEKWRAIVPYLTKDLSAVVITDANTFVSTGKPWGQQWEPPASPATALPRSESPSSSSSFTRPPPPKFLEPRVMTTAEMGLRSPKPSKLETPCLPPIGFDGAPAASGSRFSAAGKVSAMGMAMQHAGAASIGRSCVDNWTVSQRFKLAACSRRSCLSSASSTSSQNEACDTATWRCNATVATNLDPTCSVSTLTRESCLRAYGSKEPRCDETASAALVLQNISRASSAYSTPKSMDSMTEGSSISSDLDEVSTPKVIDYAARPLVRTARKRERPISVHDADHQNNAVAPGLPGLASIVKHAGGIPVDYGSGIDDSLGRSRHIRSASGSCNGARKRNCVA